MAVQVPQPVQRFEPTQPTQLDGISYQAPDESKAMAQESRAVEKIGSQVVGLIQQAEDSEIDTEVTAKINEYEMGWRTGVQQAKASQENPTDVYARFDEANNKRYDEMVSNSKLGSRGQALLRQRLANKANQLELQKLSIYGAQNQKYQEAVFTTATDNTKRNIIDAAALVNAADETSLQAIDQSVNDLINLHLRHGMKNGGVVADEKGEMTYFGEEGRQKVAVGPVADARLKEDLSESIHNTLEVLLASDNVQAANLVKEKYGSYMLPEKKKKIEDDFLKADNKQLSFRAARDPKVLDSISDPVRRDEVADMARKIRDDREASQEKSVKRYNERNRDEVLRTLMARRRSGAPIETLTELENDSKIKFALSRITDPKVRQEVEEAVVSPKTSSTTAKARVMDLLAGKPDENGKTIRDYTAEEQIIAMNGLSEADRRKAETRLVSLMSDTGPQQAAKNNRADKYFREAAIALDLVKEDKFDGKIKNKEYDKFVAMKDEFMEEVYALPPGASDETIRKMAKDWAASRKKGEVYKRPEGFQGTRVAAAPTRPDTNDPRTMTPEKEMEWRTKYFQRFGRGAKRGTTELQDFIKAESSGK